MTGPTIRVTCKNCGDSWSTPARFAGEKVQCPVCAAKLRVPEGPIRPAGSPLADDETPEALVEATCPNCGYIMSVNRGLTGRRVRCQNCGSGIYVRGPDQPPAGAIGGGHAQRTERGTAVSGARGEGHALGSFLVAIAWVLIVLMVVVTLVVAVRASEAGAHGFLVGLIAVAGIPIAAIPALLLMAAGVGLRLLCRIVGALEDR